MDLCWCKSYFVTVLSLSGLLVLGSTHIPNPDQRPAGNVPISTFSVLRLVTAKELHSLRSRGQGVIKTLPRHVCPNPASHDWQGHAAVEMVPHCRNRRVEKLVFWERPLCVRLNFDLRIQDEKEVVEIVEGIEDPVRFPNWQAGGRGGHDGFRAPWSSEKPVARMRIYSFSSPRKVGGT